MTDLFGSAYADDAEEGYDPSSGRPAAPLAVRMRPRSLDEVVGQEHLLAAGVAAAPAGRGRRHRQPRGTRRR